MGGGFYSGENRGLFYRVFCVVVRDLDFCIGDVFFLVFVVLFVNLGI